MRNAVGSWTRLSLELDAENSGGRRMISGREVTLLHAPGGNSGGQDRRSNWELEIAEKRRLAAHIGLRS